MTYKRIVEIKDADAKKLAEIYCQKVGGSIRPSRRAGDVDIYVLEVDASKRAKLDILVDELEIF